MMDEQLLTEKETAKYLKISVHTLRVHRQKNIGIPYVKMGNIRYRMSDIQEYIENNIVSTQQQERGHD